MAAPGAPRAQPEPARDTAAAAGTPAAARERAPQEEGTGREGGKEGREGRRAGASREPCLAGRRSASGSGKRGRRRAPGRPDPAHSKAPPCPCLATPPAGPSPAPRPCAPRPRRRSRPLPVAVLLGAEEASPGGAWPDRPGGEPPLSRLAQERARFVCLFLLAYSFSFSQLLAHPEIEFCRKMLLLKISDISNHARFHRGVWIYINCLLYASPCCGRY
ncbi:uncharacterized protein LOC107400146 [Peromyscus maniculatus bairdii]|uniref:uncharacterized protein LOC107400146 n=1 Tax=Peromyscus maniculatus bairdii TaxID=230844 RepID=UPI003FD5D66B